MFSRMRKHFTYVNVAMTLALVFVMTGGALAANHYLITSTKQISPKVLAALKGKTGGAGSQGSQGAQGPQGPAGSKGETGPGGKEGTAGKNGEKGEKGTSGTTGPAGTTGSAGATGPKGTTGSTGTTGPEGSPWAVGNKLPSGATETGTWADHGSKTNGEQVDVAISFTLRVENANNEAPQGEFLYAGQTGAHCKGTAAAPTAPSGYLCIYDALEEKPLGGATEGTAKFNGFSNAEHEFGAGVGKEGTIAEFETINIGTSLFPFAAAEGTWAVTAE
jgi:hypothetical protein